MTFSLNDLLSFDHNGIVLSHEHSATMSDDCAICDAMHAVWHYSAMKDGRDEMVPWANEYLAFAKEHATDA